MIFDVTGDAFALHALSLNFQSPRQGKLVEDGNPAKQQKRGTSCPAGLR